MEAPSPIGSSRRLAIVGTDGHLYVYEHARRSLTRLSWSLKEVMKGVWQMPPGPERARHLWPTWSPDGTKVACVYLGQTDNRPESTAVMVFDTIKKQEVWELWIGSTSAPIYLAWARDSQRLSFVLQQQDALSLHLADCRIPGQAEHVLTGLPLFHQFSPDGRALAVHLGGRFNGEHGRRLYRVELQHPDRRLTLSETPGVFGTPSWSPDGRTLAYTVLENDQQVLTLTENVRGPIHRLGSFSGVGSLTWSPDGSAVLVLRSPSGEPGRFTELWRYPIQGGDPQCLVSKPLAAFQMLKDGRILCFEAEMPDRLIIITLVEPDGKKRQVGAFFTSQPQNFHMQFYHQYGATHPLISPDEDYMVFSGYWTEKAYLDEKTMPRIFMLYLPRTARIQDIGEGAFGCWAPAT